MDLSESRKKKLEMLTRSLARGDIAAAGDIINARASAAPAAPLAPVPLDQACRGLETAVSLSGRSCPFWHVRREVGEIVDDGAGICRQYAAVLGGARQRLDELEASAELCMASAMNAGDLLFMDIETCGLAGCAIFLIGTMYYEDGRLVFDQCFARSYAEEAAVLAAFTRQCESAGMLVTFNGKAFDMTMIRERCAFHGVEPPTQSLPHLDLLHESRRQWRGCLPNCRLQTLERFLTGRVRVGDIPGSQIPDAYHRYVDTGDARQVRDILHHNLLDLLTMAQLLTAAMTGSGPIAD